MAEIFEMKRFLSSSGGEQRHPSFSGSTDLPHPSVNGLLYVHNTLQSENADWESGAAFLTLTFLASQRVTAFPRPALSQLP